MDRWFQNIQDAESLHEKTEDFRYKIENVLYRQQIDGLLTLQDVIEIRHVSDLWIKLLHTISSYSIGCRFVKKDVISLMLELYNLEQLDGQTFIDCSLKL